MNECATSYAWHYTLELLERVSSMENEKGNAKCKAVMDIAIRASKSKEYSALPPASAHIEIVERHSNALLTICYWDATTGRYGEQFWKLGKARGRAVCALSGAMIRRGDDVYRPSARGRVPANLNWVVLASAVPEDLGEQLALAQC